MPSERKDVPESPDDVRVLKPSELESLKGGAQPGPALPPAEPGQADWKPAT